MRGYLSDLVKQIKASSDSPLMHSYIDRLRFYFLSYQITDPDTITCEIFDDGKVYLSVADLECMSSVKRGDHAEVNANKLMLATELDQSRTVDGKWFILADIPALPNKSDIEKIPVMSNPVDFIKEHPQVLFLSDQHGHSIYYYLLMQHERDLLEQAIQLHNDYYSWGYKFERLAASCFIDDKMRDGLLAFAADTSCDETVLANNVVPYDIKTLRQYRFEKYIEKYKNCDWAKADSDHNFVKKFVDDTRLQIMILGPEDGLLGGVVLTENNHLLAISNDRNTSIEQVITEGMQRLSRLMMQKIMLTDKPREYFLCDLVIDKKDVKADNGNFTVYFKQIIEWQSQLYLEKCCDELLHSLIIKPGEVLQIKAKRIYDMLCRHEPVSQHCVIKHTSDRGLITNSVEEVRLKEALNRALWSLHLRGEDLVYRIECESDEVASRLVAIFNGLKRKLRIMSPEQNGKVIYLTFSQDDFERRIVNSPELASFERNREILEAAVDSDYFIDMLFPTILAALLKDDVKLLQLCLRLGRYCEYGLNGNNVTRMPLLVIAMVLDAKECFAQLLKQSGIELLRYHSESFEAVVFNPLVIALQRSRPWAAKMLLPVIAKLSSDRLQHYFQECCDASDDVLTYLLYGPHRKELLKEFIEHDLVRYFDIDAIIKCELGIGVKDDKLDLLLPIDCVRKCKIGDANLLQLAIARGLRGKVERVVTYGKFQPSYDDLMNVLACYCAICGAETDVIARRMERIKSWQAQFTPEQLSGLQVRDNYAALFGAVYEMVMSQQKIRAQQDANYSLLRFMRSNIIAEKDYLLLLSKMRKYLRQIDDRIITQLRIVDAKWPAVVKELVKINDDYRQACEQLCCQLAEKVEAAKRQEEQQQALQRESEAQRIAIEEAEQRRQERIALDRERERQEKLVAKQARFQPKPHDNTGKGKKGKKASNGADPGSPSKRTKRHQANTVTKTSPKTPDSDHAMQVDSPTRSSIIAINLPASVDFGKMQPRNSGGQSFFGNGSMHQQIEQRILGPDIQQNMRAFHHLASSLQDVNQSNDHIYVLASLYHLLRFSRGLGELPRHRQERDFGNLLIHTSLQIHNVDLLAYIWDLVNSIPENVRNMVYADSQDDFVGASWQEAFGTIIARTAIYDQLSTIPDYRQSGINVENYRELLQATIEDIGLVDKIIKAGINGDPISQAACRMLVVMLGECCARIKEASSDDVRYPQLFHQLINLRNIFGHDLTLPANTADSNIEDILRQVQREGVGGLLPDVLLPRHCPAPAFAGGRL